MPDSSNSANTRPTAMAPDASTSPVDWSRPIEAVHEDGRVVPASPYNNPLESWPDDEGQYHINSDGELLFANADGSAYFGYDKYHIRNVQPTTPERDPALWDRMEALVRAIADDSSSQVVVEHQDEARAIVADLPKPVDPDLIEAREFVATYHEWMEEMATARVIREGHGDHTPNVRSHLAAIKRGRQLAGEQA